MSEEKNVTKLTAEEQQRIIDEKNAAAKGASKGKGDAKK